MSRRDAAALLRRLFDTAVAAAQPAQYLAGALPEKPPGRIVVVGAGKASGTMAAALEAAWPDVDLQGTVAVPRGGRAACQIIEQIEAGHPVPDEGSVAAARRMRARVTGLRADDLVISLVSGGGSALLAEPANGISLEEKQQVTQALLGSGATIQEINAVRQHLSAIKGGRLALAAAPAPVVTLLVSDIPGDEPSLIASGPTLPSSVAPGEASAVVARYPIPLPQAAQRLLRDNPPPAADGFDDRCRHTVLCSAMQSLEAAADAAREAGYRPLILGDGIEGEASGMGTTMAGIAISARRWGQPVETPAVLLSGGESTVSLTGSTGGHGGRNTEWLLALALALHSAPDIHALAADTDGIDGKGTHAGALLGPHTLERARSMSLDPHTLLAEHDSGRLFERLDDLLITGPTGTNVNDFRAILID